MRLTGYLDVQSADGQKRGFYYHTGRLVWATGGSHPRRRWGRYLSWFCPHIRVPMPQQVHEPGTPNWEYAVLGELTKHQQITREQAIAIIEMTLVEMFFDLLQESHVGELHYSVAHQSISSSPLTAIDPERVWTRSQQVFHSWCELGLANYSPDLAPIIKQPDELQQRTSAKTYQAIVASMNGDFTLRDLAVKTRQGLITFTRSLLPYLKNGWIGLAQVPDLPGSTANTLRSFATSSQTTRSTIVCVDDSIQICQLVEKILIGAGYRCVGVQDSVQALPVLLEHKPDLILLDLVMPVANGYEICSQIRRISIFKDTPIVILTGNDGIVDRVRAKLVGASDFLAKPVDANKLLSAVQKYLTHQEMPLQAEESGKQ